MAYSMLMEFGLTPAGIFMSAVSGVMLTGADIFAGIIGATTFVGVFELLETAGLVVGAVFAESTILCNTLSVEFPTTPVGVFNPCGVSISDAYLF